MLPSMIRFFRLLLLFRSGLQFGVVVISQRSACKFMSWFTQVRYLISVFTTDRSWLVSGLALPVGLSTSDPCSVSAFNIPVAGLWRFSFKHFAEKTPLTLKDKLKNNLPPLSQDVVVTGKQEATLYGILHCIILNDINEEVLIIMGKHLIEIRKNQ